MFGLIIFMSHEILFIFYNKTFSRWDVEQDKGTIFLTCGLLCKKDIYFKIVIIPCYKKKIHFNNILYI